MENKNQYSDSPVLCNEVVFEDTEIKLTKIWTWNVKDVHEADGNICQALLDGQDFNVDGKSTFVSSDGKRLTDLGFDYLGDYEEEMQEVRINGQGYGFLNKDIQLTVPTKYTYSNDFRNGHAAVNDGTEWLFVDKNGNKLRTKNKYERLGCFSDGLARVSTMNPNEVLAYYSDYEDDAGVWGYVDEKGNEVIKPQYIYGFDFYNGRAIVAKGQWKKDENGRNSSEGELWGVIDKNGREIIPCEYDEIRNFINDDYSVDADYFIVHAGGWENGKWAIADKNGKFVTEPVFEQVLYNYCNGLFNYTNDYSCDDYLVGIYDLNENRVLFEPQFRDISFLDDGNILVDVYERNSDRRSFQKIIDKTGKNLLKSEYDSFYTFHEPYIAVKREENVTIVDRLDKNGNVLDRTEFTDKISYWDSELDFEKRRYIYTDNGKLGLKSFEGKILIPAQYDFLRADDNDLCKFEVKKNSDSRGLMKTDGTIILPPQYKDISILKDNTIICNGKNGAEAYRFEIK